MASLHHDTVISVTDTEQMGMPSQVIHKNIPKSSQAWMKDEFSKGYLSQLNNLEGIRGEEKSWALVRYPLITKSVTNRAKDPVGIHNKCYKIKIKIIISKGNW